MARKEGLRPIGDSIKKIIEKIQKERQERQKKGKPIRTQPKLPGLNKGGGADMGAKKKKYNRPPQTRNKMQPSRSMSIDTTTGISKMKEGGICRGAGAAIKGTKFQGVF